MLQFMGSQRVIHDCVIELTDLNSLVLWDWNRMSANPSLKWRGERN